MTDAKKAKVVLLIEKIRLIESELFCIAANYGVKTVEDLDRLVTKGKLSEEAIGEDLFTFDHLVSEREKLEKELLKLRIKKSEVWKNLQNLLELPKLSLRT